MKSLKFRIFFSIIILLLISLGTITLVFNFGLDRYFSDYQLQEQEANINRLEDQLITIFEEEGGEAVFQFIEQYAALNQLQYVPPNSMPMHHNMDRQMSRGNSRMMRSLAETDLNEGYNLVIGGEDFGHLFWPERNGQPALYAEISEQTSRFRNELNSFILPLGLTLVLIAGILSFVLSRWLAHPVNKLATEVEKLEQGNYELSLPRNITGELRTLAVAIKSLAARLKYLEKIRRKSASDFSHELRTPLNNLQNYIEALEDGVIAWNEENLVSLREEVERITSLTEQLNQLVQAEKGLTEINLAKIDGEKLFQEIITPFKQQANKQQVEFSSSIDFSQKLLKLDKKAVQIILSNLLSNAIKYTDAGGKVAVEIFDEKDTLKIIVADTGIGIPEKDKELVFERFYRTDESRSRSSGGSGLGLAITRELVEALGGDISLASNEKGSEFTISIPQ
ncbi:MAG: sensor histidine kinase [Bacillota bacterium]